MYGRNVLTDFRQEHLPVGLYRVEDQPPPRNGIGFRTEWRGWVAARRDQRQRNLVAIERVASARLPGRCPPVVDGLDSKEPAGWRNPTGSTTFDSVGSLGGCISQSTG